MPRTVRRPSPRPLVLGRSRLMPPRGRATAASVRARAFEAASPVAAPCYPVSYALPGAFRALRQTSADTSWAALVTMMLAWRDDRPYTIDAAMQRLGERWLDAYRRGTVPVDDDASLLLAATGLCLAPPQSLAATGWDAMLRTYGPLCMMADEDEPSFPTGGKIVVGIEGDGTPTGTRLAIVDAQTGAQRWESLQGNPGPMRLAHWPTDAALGRGARPAAPAAAAPPAATPPVAAPAQHATTASRQTWVRAQTIPDWDRPANFPPQIRAFWARSASRLHHHIWHLVRMVGVAGLSEGDRRVFERLRFTAPAALAGQPGAGLDFLAMHRRMIATTRALAERLGVPYRPTGWSEIPWDHADPDWPMPAGSSENKQLSRTAEMQDAVDRIYRNRTALGRARLDELGTLIESRIHGWMHMHWATEPEPDWSRLLDPTPSNDYLGHPISSQVNPRFWKLHGWVDDCIRAWEAAAPAGGPPRDANVELANRWEGPVPRAEMLSARARGMADDPLAHDHGDVSDAEAEALIAGLPAPTQPAFAVAGWSTDQMLAQLGLSDAGDGTVMVASLRGKRRAAAMCERHGARTVRQFDVVGGIGLGLAVFQAGQQLLTSGNFAVTTRVADYRHPQTPPETPASEFTMEFDLIAGHRAPFDPQHFWFSLQFNCNGFDLWGCKVTPLVDRSSTMLASTFEVTFDPAATSQPSDPVAQMTFHISGRWDIVGRGNFSFAGALDLWADGRATLGLSLTEDGIVSAGQLVNARQRALPGAAITVQAQDVFFSPPGSDRVDEASERQFTAWLDQQRNMIGPNLASGVVPIQLHGFASTTGGVAGNRDLSRRRAERVAQIIRDRLGGSVRIETIAHGEIDAGTPDETEDAAQRRVRVEIRR